MSRGCEEDFELESGEAVRMSLLWKQEGLPDVQRTYWLHVPASYKKGAPTPVLLVFHGWGSLGYHIHDRFGFDTLGETEGYISVYPDGMNDCVEGEEGESCRCANGERGDQCTGARGWNGVGTTSSRNGNETCDPSILKERTCYDSCRRLKGECHPCDWTSCYDDVGFIRQLLDSLEETVCIDTKKVFAFGCSNGGIFMHELVQRMPGKIASFVAACGGKPHAGFEKYLASGPPVSAMWIVGNRDHRIPSATPPTGTKWWDGYIFASNTSVVEAYADYNKCAVVEPVAYLTPQTDSNLACWLHGRSCRGGVELVSCEFEGGHRYFREMTPIVWDFFQRAR